MNEAFHRLLEHADFRLGTAWEKRAVCAGETILEEGEFSRELYLLLGGSVRIFKHVTLDGKRAIRPGFWDLEAGETFGEQCLLEEQARSATVVSITDCEIAVISADRLLSFLDGHPEIGYPLFKDLIQSTFLRLRRANSRLGCLFAWGLKSYKLDAYL